VEYLKKILSYNELSFKYQYYLVIFNAINDKCRKKSPFELFTPRKDTKNTLLQIKWTKNVAIFIFFLHIPFLPHLRLCIL